MYDNQHSLGLIILGVENLGDFQLKIERMKCRKNWKGVVRVVNRRGEIVQTQEREMVVAHNWSREGKKKEIQGCKERMELQK